MSLKLLFSLRCNYCVRHLQDVIAINVIVTEVAYSLAGVRQISLRVVLRHIVKAPVANLKCIQNPVGHSFEYIGIRSSSRSLLFLVIIFDLFI